DAVKQVLGIKAAMAPLLRRHHRPLDGVPRFVGEVHAPVRNPVVERGRLDKQLVQRLGGDAQPVEDGGCQSLALTRERIQEMLAGNEAVAQAIRLVRRKRQHPLESLRWYGCWR